MLAGWYNEAWKEVFAVRRHAVALNSQRQLTIFINYVYSYPKLNVLIKLSYLPTASTQIEKNLERKPGHFYISISLLWKYFLRFRRCLWNGRRVYCHSGCKSFLAKNRKSYFVDSTINIISRTICRNNSLVVWGSIVIYISVHDLITLLHNSWSSAPHTKST